MIPNDIDAARAISLRLPRSERWQPLKLESEDFRERRVEVWSNDIYTVTARRHDSGWVLDSAQPWAQLGIFCHNGAARHDWREFQLIKNDVCGPEWEAVELFPAESRLLDPSNYYMLWCAPKIPIGKFSGRTIATPENCIAPQRGWKGGSHAHL